MRLRLVLSLLLAVVPAGEALADCLPVRSDLDAFGVAPLGPARFEQIKSWIRPGDCMVERTVCFFRDRRGIKYGFSVDQLDWKEIGASGLRSGRSRVLEFSAEDTPDSIRRSMVARGITLSDLKDGTLNDGPLLTTGLCLSNARGQVFEAVFFFDTGGHLKLYWTQFPGPKV